MPRFFFHLRDGANLQRDIHGFMCSDLEVAGEVARQCMTEMLAEGDEEMGAYRGNHRHGRHRAGDYSAGKHAATIDLGSAHPTSNPLDMRQKDFKWKTLMKDQPPRMLRHQGAMKSGMPLKPSSARSAEHLSI